VKGKGGENWTRTLDRSSGVRSYDWTDKKRTGLAAIKEGTRWGGVKSPPRKKTEGEEKDVGVSRHRAVTSR